MGKLVYYLDHAAATPCDPRVFDAMLPYFKDIFYNPQASYGGGREARQALEQARDEVALALGAKPNEVIFTAGATESINLAVNGVMSGGGKIVISGIEHAAVRGPASQYKHAIVPVDGKGTVNVTALVEAIDDETRLVSVSYADSEFGTVQPIGEIAREIAAVRVSRQARNVKTPLYFHTDASQAATLLDLKVSRLGVDLMTLNAAKCYGPKQSGVLWIRSSVLLQPLLLGGGQERGLRSGTESVASAVGIAKALVLAQADRHNEGERLASIRQKLIDLLAAKIPDIVFDGHPKKYLPSHIHVHVDGLDAERVVFHLDNKNIYVATGAACAANRSTRLPSLTAIGLSDSEADGSLRITLGRLNDQKDVEFLAENIAEAIATERRL